MITFGVRREGMPASKSQHGQVVDIGQQDDLRVECYVRSTVPGPSIERVDTVIDRLQRLRDTGRIASYRVTDWPSKRSTASETETTSESVRDELVAEFEYWADQHGYSLEPAFRRQEIPASPLGLATDETRKRVRVPIVALALYEDNTETDALCGVVPYTEHLQTGEKQTHTVDEWLSAVESAEQELATRTLQHDHVTVLEGEQ